MALKGTNEVGRRLRYERHKAGYINRDQFAEASGLGPYTIQRFETGRSQMRLTRLLAALQTLGAELRIRWSDGSDDVVSLHE